MASIMENYILKGNTSWDGPSEGYDFALRLERGVTARLLQLDASGWVLVEVIHPSEASKSVGWAPPSYFHAPPGPAGQWWAPRPAKLLPREWASTSDGTLFQVQDWETTAEWSMSCEALTGNVLRQNPSYMNGGQIPPPSAEELASVHREIREIPTEKVVLLKEGTSRVSWTFLS